MKAAAACSSPLRDASAGRFIAGGQLSPQKTHKTAATELIVSRSQR
jgi:hypothetical protein